MLDSFQKVYVMKSRTIRLGFALAGSVAIALGYGAFGCSSSNNNSSPGGTGGSGNSTGNGTGNSPSAGGSATTGPCTGLTIAFAPDMYSAFIPGGMHKFQLPVEAQGVSDASVTWTAGDPSLVDIEPNPGGGQMLTMLNSGMTTITAKTTSGACAQSTLHITAATEDQWQAGNMRYNNGNKLQQIMTDGGIPTGNFMMFNIDPPDDPPACTNCHGDTATSSYFKTVSHTPEQTGGFSDAQLIAIFTMAAVPMDGYFDSNLVPVFIWQFFHKWSDIQGDAQQGMVVYLRSLTPKSQGGMFDFGQFMIPRLMPPTGTAGTTGSTGGTTSSSSGGSTSSSSGGTTSSSSGGTTSTGGGGGTTSSSGGAAGEAGEAGASSGGAAGAASGGASGSAGEAGAAGSQ